MKAPRRAAVWAAAAATVVLLLVLVLRPPTPSPTHNAGAPPRPTAAESAAGHPGDPAPTEEGAQAAAVAVATASQDWLYLGDAAMGDAVRSVATAGAGPALAAETVAELGRARDGLALSPGRVWWVVRPLASHVESYDPPRARVVVWTVTVLSAAEVALPQADWSRVAVDLVWEAGRWRASAVTDTPGPTPAVGAKDRPWQAVAFDEALAGFERAGSTGGRP